MKKFKMPDSFPAEGFLKISGRPRTPQITSEQKVTLIRKGNVCFNNGDFATAKKIFITTGYSDGLIRLGDKHVEEGDFIEALRMYKMAPDEHKCEAIIEKTAAVIKKWLHEKG